MKAQHLVGFELNVAIVDMFTITYQVTMHQVRLSLEILHSDSFFIPNDMFYDAL